MANVVLLQFNLDIFQRSNLQMARPLFHLKHSLKTAIFLLVFSLFFVKWLLGIRIDFHHRGIIDVEDTCEPAKDSRYIKVESDPCDQNEDGASEAEYCLKTREDFC